MSAYSDHAAQLAALQSELGGDCPSFTWNNAPYSILPGGAKFKRMNDAGGFKLESDLQLTCLTAPFGGTLPDAGQTLTYNGLLYTITAVTPAPAGYQMRINADLNVQGM